MADVKHKVERAAFGAAIDGILKYVNRILNEVDPHVIKMSALDYGFEAAFCGKKEINEMRVKHQCNIPWLILMDPTSACNLHCTGCWAAEYGNRLNLSFEDMDRIVTLHRWRTSGQKG